MRQLLEGGISLRYLIALSSAILLATAMITVASAAPKPDNKKVDVIDVHCDDLGDLQVVTLQNNSVVAWGSGGQVFVAKRFLSEFNATVTTNDGNTYSVSDSFDDVLAKGNGFKERLIRCTFSEQFTDVFILDEQAAIDFGVPLSYVGTEVTLQGTFDGTAWVMPARR
jgi:hypothetical protein